MRNAWVPTTTADLEAEACAATGLGDFGETDYREALDILLTDYARHARVDAAGAAATRGMLVDLLARRLRSQQALNGFDALKPLVRPWIILSMPRSGTTALHRLLCADPNAQGLEYWLGSYPQPRPPHACWTSHPDYLATAAQLDAMRAKAPRLFAQHTMAADAVDECRLLLMQGFANITFFSNATLPDYERWLWSSDIRPAYARHRALLQLIDGGLGRRWILKDPSHLMTLDAMVATYPDLRVICTRRPASRFLPSVASLVFESRRASEPDVPREQVGRDALATWSRAAHALQHFRETHPHVPWFDVEQEDLRADPIGVCRRIYAHFDELFPVATEQVMRATLTSGLHAGATLDKPTLAQFGLCGADVAAAFPEEFQ